VPSKSTGFWVAKTVNQAGSGRRTPSVVTWRSSMHSSRAAWVRGGMRLISSTRSRSVKTGPAWKVKVLLPWARMVVPRMSAGMRSGVAWTRWKLRPSSGRGL
jgi:hypothetical protein